MSNIIQDVLLFISQSLLEKMSWAGLEFCFAKLFRGADPLYPRKKVKNQNLRSPHEAEAQGVEPVVR